jgi:hypothetical protein
MVLILLSFSSLTVAAANNHDIQTLRNDVFSLSAKVHSYTPRRLEQQDNEYQEENEQDDENENDDVVKTYEQGAKSTFGDMFYTSPSTWSATEWGVFAGLLTLFGVIFCCWCLVCAIPKCSRACFGDRAAPMMYAAMV